MKFDGKKLKDRRNKLGLSLKNVADLTASSKSYIFEIEQDKGIEPGGNKVFLLSKALGVSMEWFYGEDSQQEDIKQAIVRLAHGSVSVIGTGSYYDICKLLYPDFEMEQPK